MLAQNNTIKNMTVRVNNLDRDRHLTRMGLIDGRRVT